MLPWLALGYGVYKGYELYNEGRALRDYRKRYPWVKVKYPSRLKAYRSLGGMFGVAGAYYGGRAGRRYDRVKYYYR